MIRLAVTVKMEIQKFNKIFLMRLCIESRVPISWIGDENTVKKARIAFP